MKLRDPAPALGRGLSLLKRLSEDGPTSLERLALGSGWPKSSVLRILASLEAFGAVRRDPISRRYEPLLRLALAVPAEELRRAEASKALVAISRECGQAAELYSFDAGHLTMTDRCEPEENEVYIRARIGWEPIRNEVLALMQLVLAFGLPPSEWPRGQLWYWRHSRRTPLSRPMLLNLIRRVRAQRFAACLHPNVHGVQRFAAPIFERGSQLWGVLAVAAPPLGRLSRQLVEPLLRRTAERLSEHSVGTT